MARRSVRYTIIVFSMLTVAFAFAFLIQSYSSTKLLTENVEEVQTITVVNLRNGNRTSEITKTESKDLINTIYQAINTTKIRTIPENVSTEPYFTIRVNYSDGTKDFIYSGESSDFISKRLSQSEWVGGKNNVLIEVVNRL